MNSLALAKSETPLPTAMDAETLTAASKSNFALSFLFLPRAKRKAITNFYAFSRVLDDAVDDYPAEQARELLKFWRKELAQCYEGHPTHPITKALQESIREFQLSREYFELLLEGCEWDLNKHRYATYQELYQYCYRVAGCIGLVCMEIFGLRQEKAKLAGEYLGLALQLTNILRDVAEDASRGRLYLPQEDIKRYGLNDLQVMGGAEESLNSKQRILLKLISERAEVLYNRAFTEMKALPRRPLVAAWIMGKVYYALLKKIRRRHYQVYGKKIKVSKFTKIVIALKYWLLSF